MMLRASAGSPLGYSIGMLLGLSLGLLLGSSYDFPNTGYEMSGTLLGAHIGLWFGSDVVGGVGIYCISHSRSFITSKMNPVRYCQLLELLNLSL